MPRLTKTLSTDLQLIRTSCYPLRQYSQRPYRHHALLGIGGNMGDVIRRFEHLYNFLVKSPSVTVIETSPILRNPPFGYLDQEDFYNAVMHIQTDLTAMQLLWYILHTEKRFGRKRSFANAPRTLDIDMIFYDTCKIDKPRLQVPHPHWQERDSVVIPFTQMKGTPWSKRHL
jgi:2-amino-4-hydroxy-6-hydroxymethyldihydropteridine diphosphokinase